MFGWAAFPFRPFEGNLTATTDPHTHTHTQGGVCVCVCVYQLETRWDSQSLFLCWPGVRLGPSFSLLPPMLEEKCSDNVVWLCSWYLYNGNVKQKITFSSYVIIQLFSDFYQLVQNFQYAVSCVLWQTNMPTVCFFLILRGILKATFSDIINKSAC